MREGIHEIIGSEDNDGVKPAECRTKIQYWYVVITQIFIPKEDRRWSIQSSYK